MGCGGIAPWHTWPATWPHCEGCPPPTPPMHGAIPHGAHGANCWEMVHPIPRPPKTGGAMGGARGSRLPGGIAPGTNGAGHLAVTYMPALHMPALPLTVIAIPAGACPHSGPDRGVLIVLIVPGADERVHMPGAPPKPPERYP